MKRKALYFAFGIAVVFVVVLLAGSGSGKSLENFDEKMSIYKSSSCGCCEVYFQYFKGKGNSNVNLVTIADNKKIMEEYGDRKSTRLTPVTIRSRMPSSA